MAKFDNPFSRARFEADATAQGQIEQEQYDSVTATASIRDPSYSQYPLINQEKQLMWILFDEVDQSRERDETTVNWAMKEKKGFDINRALSDVSQLSQVNYKERLWKNLTGKAVALYLPGAVQMQSGANYSNENLGIFGNMIMRSLRANNNDGANLNIGEIVKSGQDMGDQIAGPALNFYDGITRGEVSTDMIVGLVQMARVLPFQIGQAEVNGVTAGLRRTTNPHTHAIFNSVSIREFTFSWEFMPSNKEEADHVKRIIYFFRRNMHPEYTEPEIDLTNRDTMATADYFTYKYPTMLRPTIGFIHPRTGEFRTELDDGSPFAFKIKDCYIKNVSVTYDDQNSMTIHQDGHFVSCKLDITIQEEVALSREDVIKGY